MTYRPDDVGGVMHATRRPDRWVRTTCGYCSVGCGMLLGVRGNQAVSVMGDPDHPVNAGRLCPKGLAEHHVIAAPGRLTTPLVRHAPDGEQEPVTWDEALTTVVDGFRRLQHQHGPDSVAVLSTGQLVTEEFYALGKLVRLGLGIRHHDGNTTLCMASAVAGYKRSFGSDGPPGCYDDIDQADCILLVGANIADNHPLLAPRVLGNRDATVIVVDPRVTKTAAMADIHLPVRPRTDVTLLNGMVKILLDEGLVDTAYVDRHTVGFQDLAASVATYPLERVAAETGVEADSILRAARAFGRAERAFVGWTMGVNHSVQGTETVTLLNTLCLITGNVGRPGAAPMSITGQCNAMGVREAGGTSSLPGYRSYDSPADRAELAELWGLPLARIPSARGRAYPDIVDGVLDGTVKGLWIVATNPPVSFPNRGRLEGALRKLELLVVQDGFETPTTVLADVVLPAAIWGEKDGTYTNSERRVSRVRKAVDPPGLARTDFDIFLAVAAVAGVADELFGGWNGPEDAFEEWRRVSAGRLCDYQGLSWASLDHPGPAQWGGPRLYADGRFPTPDGRARLWPVSPAPISDAVDERFPFLLNTGRTVEHWHTRTKTGRVQILESLAPEGWVEINPGDARRLGVGPGDPVRVRSRRGMVENVPVRVTATVREGEVFMPFHYDELCANRLTIDEFDPISREPNYKQAAVHVEAMAVGARVWRGCERADSGRSPVGNGSNTPVGLTAGMSTGINRRTFLLGAGAAGLGGVLAACGTGGNTSSGARPAGSSRTRGSRRVRLGFIALTDASSVILAEELGYFAQRDLDVEVLKQASWPATRDALLNHQIDACHGLYTLPFSVATGIGGNGTRDLRLAMVLNNNGQAISLSRDYASIGYGDPARARPILESRDAPAMAMTFPGGTHDLWLRYWLLATRANLANVKISPVPPAQMVQNMSVGNVDGYCVGEPWGAVAVQRGIGFTHIATQDIWLNHPEKGLVVTQKFATEQRDALKDVMGAVLQASRWLDDPANRAQAADTVAPENYINAPAAEIRGRLTGVYDLGGGLGTKDFKGDQMQFFRGGQVNFPRRGHAVWALSQYVRMGLLKESPPFQELADQLILTDLYAEVAAAEGVPLPDDDMAPFELRLDRTTFDPRTPDQEATRL